MKQPYQRGYQRTTSPRAWTPDGEVLVPPEILEQRRQAWLAAGQRKPRTDVSESTQRRLDELYGSPSRRAPQFISIAAPPERPVQELVAEWRAKQAREKAASSSSSSPLRFPPPPSEEGGYRTSVHTNNPQLLSGSGETGPAKPAVTSDPAWMQRERELLRLRGEREAQQRARDQAWIEKWADDMAAKAKARGRGG